MIKAEDLTEDEINTLIFRLRPPAVRLGGGMWSCCTGRCQAAPRDSYCDCVSFRDMYYGG